MPSLPPGGVAAAPQPARLSILALLGFLAGAALFAGGAAAVAFTGWLKAGDWSILDHLVRERGGRDALAGLIFAEPAAIHGAVLMLTVGAIIATAVVGAFNAATLFSVGRRAGVRGGGYAVFGLGLTVLGGLGALGAGKTVG